MPAIATIVFFDIETTGLPLQEQNQTKIIEYSFVAVLRKDIEATPYGQMPPIVSKIGSVLNPEKKIGRVVTQMTGLSRRKLAKAPTFKEMLASITSFLNALPAPVCLLAHNGNTFDFKILLAECNDISASLPVNLYCVDSLPGFRSILMGTGINYSNLGGDMTDINPVPVPQSSKVNQPDLTVNAAQNKITEEIVIDSVATDFVRQDLMVSADEDEVIGELIIDGSCDDAENQEPVQDTMNNKKRSAELIDTSNKKKCVNVQEGAERECFKLVTVYKRLLNKEAENAHRAEGDCLMLMQCVVAIKKQFLPWADKNCQLLTKIKPLSRTWWRRSRFYR